MDDIPNEAPSRDRINLVVIPVTMIVLGVCSYFTIDARVSGYFHVYKLTGWLRDFIDAGEHFGTPYGQIIGLLCVSAAIGWKEWRIVRIFTGASIAGLIANLCKLLIGRTRPHHFHFETDTIRDSFVGWLPLWSGNSDIQSFPSAHTASAFAFAALLTWAYPKGRTAFIVFAALVGIHRITASAHFPSDVFIGGALGWTIGWLFTGKNFVAKRFDALERRKDTGSS